MKYTSPDGAVFEDAPITRESRQTMCRFCKTRPVISDGYGGYVHEDDYRYQCNVNDKKSTFAEARI